MAPTLRLTNTLTRLKEPFQPIDPANVAAIADRANAYVGQCLVAPYCGDPSFKV